MQNMMFSFPNVINLQSKSSLHSWLQHALRAPFITHSIKKLIDLGIPLIKLLKRILCTSYQTKEKRKKRKTVKLMYH